MNNTGWANVSAPLGGEGDRVKEKIAHGEFCFPNRDASIQSGKWDRGPANGRRRDGEMKVPLGGGSRVANPLRTYRRWVVCCLVGGLALPGCGAGNRPARAPGEGPGRRTRRWRCRREQEVKLGDEAFQEVLQKGKHPVDGEPKPAGANGRREDLPRGARQQAAAAGNQPQRPDPYGRPWDFNDRNMSVLRTRRSTPSACPAARWRSSPACST